MTKVMEVLFSYAQDYLEKPLLLLEPEYETTLHHANSQEQRLLALLDEGGQGASGRSDQRAEPAALV